MRGGSVFAGWSGGRAGARLCTLAPALTFSFAFAPAAPAARSPPLAGPRLALASTAPGSQRLLALVAGDARVALVQQDGAAHDLHDVDAGEGRQLIGDREAIGGAVGGDLELDQLVIVQRLSQLLHQSRGDAGFTDLDDG